MRLLVFMRDGRTVYRIRRRHDLAQLVRATAWDDQDTTVIWADRGIWSTADGDHSWLNQVKLRHISPGSISHVELDQSPATPMPEMAAAS